MANQSISTQPVTFKGISGLYHFFRNEAQDPVAARNLTDFIHGLKFTAFPPDKTQVSAYFNEATTALGNLIRDIKRYENRIALPYSGLDHNMTLLRLERKGFAEQVSGVKKDNLGVLIKKIIEVVKERFRDQEVEHLLSLEADRQQNMIENSQLCMGLAGIYEICVKRPNLGYDLIRGAADLRFLGAMRNHLVKVIPSFSAKDNSSQQNEGIYLFGRLIHEIGANKEVFGTLCVEGSDAEFFVNLALKPDPQNCAALYHKFRAALLSQFSGGYAESHQVLDLIDQKALEISARVPDRYKGSSAAVAGKIADSFTQHKDHGSGAMLFGQENFAVRIMSQWFGEGPKEGPIAVVVDPTSQLSLDNTQASEALKQKIRNQVAQAVKDYYEQGKLVSFRYEIHSANFLQEIPLTNEADKAMGTVQLVVGEKINQHIRDRLIMFGLDPQQRRNLGIEKAKEVILFGIQNNIFSPFPLFFVCRQYGITQEDQGPIGDKLREIMREPEALLRSMAEYARTQPPELREMIERSPSARDPNESKRD